ncbi:hypothetical protein P7C70_g762, partial [Phenoliferia sp. Uapishka_3]
MTQMDQKAAWKTLELDLPLHFQEDELKFFKSATGIQSIEELATHVKKVQAEAYHEVYPYPCIRSFNFCRFRIRRSPIYEEVLARGIKEGNALFLDLGCCFGTDVRSIIAAGYPAEFVIGSDLQAGFIDYGHKIFLDTPSTSPAFIVGDIFSPEFFSPDVAESASTPLPRTLKTLTPLKHKIRHLHASAFFHLFDEATQLQLAHLVLPLLVPSPGSTLFGSHVGAREAGLRAKDSNRSRGAMFCHNPESWKNMWKEVLGDIKAEVAADLVDSTLLTPVGEAPNYRLAWSVVFC